MDMRKLRYMAGLGIVGALGGVAWADAPFAVTTQPEKFRVTTFASGLNFPTQMKSLGDGSLLVATSVPNTGFFDSVGSLVRLVDGNHDGVADGPATTLYTGLPGSVTAVELAGNLVFVTSAAGGQERISVLRQGATPGDAYSFVGSVNFAFPGIWSHTTYGLAVRPTSGGYEVYFNLGSKENAATNPATVAVSGMISANLAGESIYRFTVQDNGGSVVLGAPQQIASGLRNSAGMAFHPVTGDLYFEDNGIDGFVNVNEPESADELNRITAGTIGTGVPNFGFATDYIQYRTGVHVGSGGVAPVVVFQPHPDPLTGSESEGANQIAFAPASFPTGLNNGVFVGFHGKFGLFGVANEENPLVYYDLGTGQYFDFLSNDLTMIGHLDGLLATGDSLFVADLTGPGSEFTSTPDGRIYQIQVVPEAGTLGLLLAGLAGLVARRGRRRAGGE